MSPVGKQSPGYGCPLGGKVAFRAMVCKLILEYRIVSLWHQVITTKITLSG